MKRIDAGKYNRKIKIIKVKTRKDEQGFPFEFKTTVLEPYASVKTTRGFTLIKNDSDFEKAFTNFTFRFPVGVIIDRDMRVEFRGKTYEILYINNVDEKDVELELQTKEVTH